MTKTILHMISQELKENRSDIDDNLKSLEKNLTELDKYYAFQSDGTTIIKNYDTSRMHEREELEYQEMITSYEMYNDLFIKANKLDQEKNSKSITKENFFLKYKNTKKRRELEKEKRRFEKKLEQLRKDILSIQRNNS